MDLTPEEKDFVRPYLLGRPRRWLVWAEAVAGLVLCIGSAALRWTDYWLVAFVIGLVLLEQAWATRDRARLARVLRKYDAMAERLRYPEEDDVTE